MSHSSSSPYDQSSHNLTGWHQQDRWPKLKNDPPPSPRPGLVLLPRTKTKARTFNIHRYINILHVREAHDQCACHDQISKSSSPLTWQSSLAFLREVRPLQKRVKGPTSARMADASLRRQWLRWNSAFVFRFNTIRKSNLRRWYNHNREALSNDDGCVLFSGFAVAPTVVRV